MRFVFHPDAEDELNKSIQYYEDIDDIGIIYRFRAERDLIGGSEHFDYYKAPPFIDALDVLRSLEVNQSNDFEKWQPVDFIMGYKLTCGQRYWECLKLSEGSTKHTRIGHQEAAFIVPDEIHHESRRDDGEQLVSFQAVEDIAAREGVSKFYFKHTKEKLNDKNLSEEKLWPTESMAERKIIELLRNIVCAESIFSKSMRGRMIFQNNDIDLWFPERPEFIYLSPSSAIG